MSPEFKAIIMSAADEQYFTLAQDLVSSIRAQKFKVQPDLGLLDVGLGAAEKEWFTANGVRVMPVGSDIDYPLRAKWEVEKPGHRTLTARPYLRNYFPGYDVYMWIDADIWVQTPLAIDTMLAAAAVSPAIHMSLEFDRGYSRFFQHAGIWQVYRDWYKASFGDDVAAAMTLKPMLNAGVFAMSKSSPVWEAWANIYAETLRRATDAMPQNFMADQLGLNIVLYLQNMPYAVMPANFNWMTFYALPKLDKATGLYVEPLPPYAPISQFHLTQKIKEQIEKIECLDGATIERPLTWRGRA